MVQEILEERGKDTILKIKVKPNSKKFKINGINTWRKHLQIKLKLKPKRGKANQELLNKLKSLLKKNIKIMAGEKSREKKIIIKNTTVAEVIQKLNLQKLKNEKN